ncbi:zinc finger, CCHC-type containing protein [Tanacetum coccineum]
MTTAMKHMASNFAKREKFEGVDFRRWQKKMHFLLSSMSVVYVLTTLMPKDGGDNPTADQNVETSKEPWDTLEAKFCRTMLKFTQHKMNMDESIQVSCIIDKLLPSWKDFKHTLKHLKEELTLVVVGRHLRIEESLRMQDNDKPKGNNVFGLSVVNMVEHDNSSRHNGLVDGSSNSLKGQNMFNKSLQIYYVTYVFEAYFVQDDDVAWWVDSGATEHVCKDRCWFKTYESLNDGSILHIGNESTALVHGRSCVDLSFSDNIGSAFMSTSKLNDSILWHARLGHVHFKRMQDMSKDGLIPAFDMDTKKWLSQGFWGEAMVVVRLPNLKLKTLGERGIDASLLDMLSIPRLLVVPEKVTEEVVQQPEPKLKKSKRHRTPKDFGPEFQFYLIEGVRDEVSDQHSYCFNVEDDPKIFDKVLTDLSSRLQTFWGCKWIFKRKLKVDRTVEKFKARLVIQGFRKKSRIGYFDTFAPVAPFLNGELDEEQAPKQSHQKFDEVVLFNGYLLNQADKFRTLMDTNEKLMPNNGQAVSQLEYSRLIGCLMYVITCTRPDIAFIMGKLSRYTSNPGTQHWQAIQLVFLLGGGAISLASKKQTCSTGSTMKSEFVALAAASKESEWLKNLLLEIPLLSKPIAHISIRCDSAATLAKAYSQMYNGKSRHLGVRHSMIRELITNGVVSIEFVRSQQNLADHLTKGLARDLVIKSAEGMGLKGLKHMYLQIIPRMCLEPAEKEDDVVNFLMVNVFEKVLSGSMNKEEPPMYSNGLKGSILRNIPDLNILNVVQFIPGNGAGVSNSGLKDIHQSDGFSVSRRIPSGSNPSEEVSSVD